MSILTPTSLPLLFSEVDPITLESEEETGNIKIIQALQVVMIVTVLTLLLLWILKKMMMTKAFTMKMKISSIPILKYSKHHHGHNQYYFINIDAQFVLYSLQIAKYLKNFSVIICFTLTVLISG
jgi:hypothetical protein